MAYPFPPDVAELVREQMACGEYASEDDLLRDALHALVDRSADLIAIQAGFDDMQAGRMEPLSDVDAKIRGRLGFPLRK